MRLCPFLAVILVFVSCGGVDTSKGVASTGESLYQEHCVLCHGESGAAQVSGAKDLSVSDISRKNVVEIITNGRRLMRAYSDLLTAEEIEEVTDHVMQLRKQ